MNAVTRVRRDLRFLLADRYRSLLASRFVALAALAAGVLDRSTSLAATARRLRSRRAGAPVPGVSTGVSVVRAAVAGQDLSITVRGAPLGADGIALRRGATTLALSAAIDRGSLWRAVAPLPVEACDGEDWTVTIAVDGSHHDIAVVDPAALAVRTVPRRATRGDAEPRTADWPPRLRADGGRLTLRGAAPLTGITHTVEVGVRTAIVTWPVDTAASTASLLLLADGDEHGIEAQVRGGTARAILDLGAFDNDGTWLAYATGPAGRAALVLPRDTYPPMDGTGRPHRVPLPTSGTTGRVVEVGYSPDNQLVVRVGNVAPAAS